MCRSTDNISEVYHKYTPWYITSWLTDAFMPDVAPMDQVRRHAWCTMFNACRFAVALRRGRGKLNRKFGSIFRDATVEMFAYLPLPGPRNRVVASNRNDRFLRSIRPSPQQTIREETTSCHSLVAPFNAKSMILISNQSWTNWMQKRLLYRWENCFPFISRIFV